MNADELIDNIKFIADKQQALSDAQSLSYRGATYIEKPL